MQLVKDILMPLIYRVPTFQETLLVNEVMTMRKYLKENPNDSSARHYFLHIKPESTSVNTIAAKI